MRCANDIGAHALEYWTRVVTANKKYIEEKSERSLPTRDALPLAKEVLAWWVEVGEDLCFHEPYFVSASKYIVDVDENGTDVGVTFRTESEPHSVL